MRFTSSLLVGLALSLLAACSDSDTTDTGSVSTGAGGSASGGGGSGGSGAAGTGPCDALHCVQGKLTLGSCPATQFTACGAPVEGGPCVVSGPCPGSTAGAGGSGGSGAGTAGASAGGSAGTAGASAGSGAAGASAGASGASGQGGAGGAVGPGCCAGDAECKAQGLDQCVAAVCREPLKEGQCWANHECQAGLECLDPAPCPCNLDCYTDHPGQCVLPAGTCCTTAADCAGQGLENAHCVAGRCKALAQPGESCWSDGDCASNESCQGMSICPCGADACDPVPDQPGKCQANDLPDGQCHDHADCEKFESCLPPGSPTPCGICQQPTDPCSTDAECKAKGEAFICGQPACVCGATCVVGCLTSSDCGTGETCTPSHHCTPVGCTNNAGCPANFYCDTLPETGVCARKGCTADSDCAGHCVNGLCYPEAGTCQAPVP